MSDLSADKSDEDEDSIESFTYNLDDIEDDDDDIDIEYDWNAKKSIETAPTTHETEEKDSDHGADNDIDVDYDWDANKSFKSLVPIDVDQKAEYEFSFDLDSPKLLDTPLYSETPNIDSVFNYRDSMVLQNIVDLNVTMNSYHISDDSIDISHMTAESPMSEMSELTQDGAQLFPYGAQLRPSHSARTMDVIEENNTDGCTKEQKEEHTATDYIQRIDCLLATYYSTHHKDTYFDAEGIGKFVTYCAANNVSNGDIYGYFTTELNDCTYLDFDETFPFQLSNDMDGDHIDSSTQLQLRQMEIYTVIKYCFDHNQAPN